MRKKSKETEQNLEEWNSARRRSQAKCQLVQTSYINEFNCSCFCHIINILLTELSRSVWENLDLGRVYRPHSFSSPEAALLLVSIKNHDLWPCPTTEVRDSRTSRHSAHAPSQVWQIWLVLVSIFCVYKSIQNRNVVGAGQRSRFLVLTKRSAASGDENETSLRSVCTYDLGQDSPIQTSCSVNKS